MTEADFETYLVRTVPGYAQEHVKAGSLSPEDALEKAKQEFRKLLPDGPHTRDHYLYTVEDEADYPIGILWFAKQERGAGRTAFAYDIEIFPPYRRRGYGSQVFRLLEDKVRDLGLSTISLHVFGHNHAARAMYRGLGYAETHVMMSKSLDAGTAQGSI